MDKNIEAYIYIVKYKDSEDYYLDIKGNDDEIVPMMAAAIVEDQRLTDGAEVAFQYFDNYGGQNRN